MIRQKRNTMLKTKLKYHCNLKHHCSMNRRLVITFAFPLSNVAVESRSLNQVQKYNNTKSIIKRQKAEGAEAFFQPPVQ